MRHCYGQNCIVIIGQNGVGLIKTEKRAIGIGFIAGNWELSFGGILILNH
jgi:hypothetical protein